MVGSPTVSSWCFPKTVLTWMCANQTLARWWNWLSPNNYVFFWNKDQFLWFEICLSYTISRCTIPTFQKYEKSIPKVHNKPFWVYLRDSFAFPQLCQVKKTHPTKLQALVLVKVIATVTSYWLSHSWKNNPSNYGWNAHMFENSIEKLPQMYILSALWAGMSITLLSHQVPQKLPWKLQNWWLFGYTSHFNMSASILRILAAEKNQTNHFLLNSPLLREIRVTISEFGGFWSYTREVECFRLLVGQIHEGEPSQLHTDRQIWQIIQVLGIQFYFLTVCHCTHGFLFLKLVRILHEYLVTSK